MKVFIIVVSTLLGALTLSGIYFLGRADGRYSEMSKLREKMGFTRGSARLYKQAKSILIDLDVSTSDMNLFNSGNILSPETKAIVSAWVADYRKEVNKL